MKLADRWRNLNWETLRGSWLPDTNRSVILVKAPVERIGQVLAETGYHWQRDVLGERVVIVERALIVYRIRGHSWSCIVGTVAVGKSYLDLVPQAGEFCRALSAQLKTSAIQYSIGKTAGVRGYTLYEKGKERESFNDIEGEMHFTSKQRPGLVPNIRRDLKYSSWGIFFSPERRKIRGKVPDSREFVNEFLRSHDALDSGITFEYFFRADNRHAGSWKKGKAKKLQNLGMAAFFWDGDAVTRPPLERVDFFHAS
jgi:hypothetical protein